MKQTRTGEIYLLISPSKKSYVGQTIRSTSERWKQHCTEALNPDGKDQCRALNAAIRKYGKDTFEVNILWSGEIGEENSIINEMECHYIKLYNSLSPYGYNLREGGNGAMSQESIDRMIAGNIVKTQNKKKLPGEDLPKFVLYHYEVNKNGTILEGYKVSDHPKGSNKSFLKKSMTLDQRKEAAISYKNHLDASTDYVDNKKKTPKYINKYGASGFKVDFPPHPKKHFGKKSKEENLADAIQYLESIKNLIIHV